MAYIGSRPDNVISRNAQNEYNYTATGGQTTFAGADSNNNTLSYTPGNIEVYFNGARLEESDFTATNGTSIVLANAAVVNDELSIVAMRVFEVESISSFNTSDLAEGSNLYFTNARADARISAADTDDLSEGSTNLYFTNARADARIAAADTDDLSEGSTNLYFTNARVAGYLSSNDFDTATNIVASITDSAPSTLDTLNELAAALGDDANFSTTVTNSIATKLPLAGGTMTGDIDMSTHQIVFDNNSQAIQIKDAGGTASYVLYQDNSDTLILGNGTTVEKIRLDTSGNEGAVVIDTNGNVGIGTNGPEYPLQVSGSNVLSGGGLATFGIYDNGTAYNGTNPGGGVTFRGKYTSANAITNFATVQGIKENAIDGNYDTALRFTTRENNGNLTEKVRISSGGNVGINNSTPPVKLSVGKTITAYEDSIAITGINSNADIMAGIGFDQSIDTLIIRNDQSFAAGGIAFRPANGTATKMFIRQDGYVSIGGTHAPVETLDLRFSGRHGIICGSTSGSGSYIVLDGAGNGDAAGSDYAYIEHTSSGNLNFNVGNGSNSTNTKMLIEPGGNVGIGTANSSYKLDISGVGAEQLRLKSSGDTGYTQGAMIIESSDSSSNPGNRGQGVYYYNVPNQRTWYTGTLYNNGNKFGFGYRQVSGFQVDAADNLHAVMVIDGDSKEVGIGVTNPSATLHVEDDGTGGNSGHMKIGHTRTRTFYAGISSSENRWYKVLNYSGGNMFTGKIQIYITRNGGYNQTGAHKEYRASLGGYSNNVYGPLSLSGDGGEGGVASLEVGTDAGIYLRVNSSIYGGTVYVTFSGQGGMSWAYSNSSYSTSLP